MAIKCVVSEQINAPPETVFAAATDFANSPQRFSGIKKAEVLTRGRIGKGTRFSETRIMFGKEATATMEVIDFQPGKSYTRGSKDGGCDYRMVVSVRPTGSGTSEISFDFSGTPITFGTRLMSPLIGLMVKTVGAKALRKDLADLKVSIEKPGPV